MKVNISVELRNMNEIGNVCVIQVMCLYWAYFLTVAKSSWSFLKPMGDESAQQCCSFVWVTCELFRQEIKETSCFVRFLIELWIFFFWLGGDQEFKWAQKRIRRSFGGVGQLVVVKHGETNAASEWTTHPNYPTTHPQEQRWWSGSQQLPAPAPSECSLPGDLLLVVFVSARTLPLLLCWTGHGSRR